MTSKTIYQCDKCGIEAETLVTNDWRSLKMEWYEEDGPHYARVDLCSGCVKALVDWLERNDE